MSALLISNLLLWLIVLALSIVVFMLTRQIGILHQRISPVGALMIDKGPDVGDKAPVVDVKDINGNDFQIGNNLEKAQLLFFMSPDCPVCKSLFPALKSIYKDEGKWLNIILVSDGKNIDEHVSLIEKNKLNEFRYVLSAEVGLRFQVGKLPYCILIDEGKINAKGLCNTREHLESLLIAKETNVASMQKYVELEKNKKAINSN